jgi:hypothetical protein
MAWAVSLTGHGLLVFGVVQLCAALRRLPDSPKPVVNSIIEPPADYCSVSISLGDEPRKRTPAPVRSKTDPPKQRDELPEPKAVQVQRNSVGPPAKDDPGVVQPSHNTSGVLHLHGRLTRAGASIVYVLDQSGSMARDGKLKQALAMLKASLAQLGPDVRFQIVVYDSKPAILRIGGSRELVGASEANLAQADALLSEIIGEGSSRHCDGLIAGLGLHPEVLILLTDADELSTSEVNRCKLWNRKATAIHAFIFGESEGIESSLRELTGPERLHHVEPERP